MISKGKIIFYQMFMKDRKSPDYRKKLCFFHKLILLQVRRFSSYKEITDISHFEWEEAKKKAKRQYKILFKIIAIYLFIDFTIFYRNYRIEKIEATLEQRRKENIPDFPRYKMFGDNPYWDSNEIEYYLKDSSKKTD
ncbi:hypothetical protein PGB90_006960 [Kerria lacca]